MANEIEEALLSGEDPNVVDDTEKDDAVVPVQYEITSFGADYDTEGLVRRLEREDIYIPPFQRGYIWSRVEASRFIESLLLGLPVPGIFLARDRDSKKLLVIDGQQRLKTLRFFFDGYFDPDPDSTTKQVFGLIKVQDRFEGRTYQTLEEKDRIILNDSIIHATIVKQESPKNQQSSIYHIFQRLNTSGRKLSPQQIRVAIYHGKFIDTIKELNDYESWCKIFGRKSKTLKDQELIIRFLAMYFDGGTYTRPINDFLNTFTENSMKQKEDFISTCEVVFKTVIDLVFNAIGAKAFRPERAINAAVYDSVMVGLARRLEKGPILDLSYFLAEYNELLGDADYIKAISQSTSDDKNVEYRLKKVTEKFAALK
jgi:hypothetical protein